MKIFLALLSSLVLLLCYGQYSLMKEIGSQPQIYVIDIASLHNITNYKDKEEIKEVLNKVKEISSTLALKGNIVLNSGALAALPINNNINVIDLKKVRQLLKSSKENKNEEN